jgi:hypothetical protein
MKNQNEKNTHKKKTPLDHLLIFSPKLLKDTLKNFAHNSTNIYEFHNDNIPYAMLMDLKLTK